MLMPYQCKLLRKPRMQTISTWNKVGLTCSIPKSAPIGVCMTTDHNGCVFSATQVFTAWPQCIQLIMGLLVDTSISNMPFYYGLNISFFFGNRVCLSVRSLSVWHPHGQSNSFRGRVNVTKRLIKWSEALRAVWTVTLRLLREKNFEQVFWKHGQYRSSKHCVH